MRLGSIDRMALSEEGRALVRFVNEQSTALDCNQAAFLGGTGRGSCVLKQVHETLVYGGSEKRGSHPAEVDPFGAGVLWTTSELPS